MRFQLVSNFRFEEAGFMKRGKLLITMILLVSCGGAALSRDRDKPDARSPAGAAPQEKQLSFTMPQVPWTLTLPADNFEIVRRQMKEDGSGVYFYLIDEKQGIDLSMFIEPAVKCKNSKSCRDMVWKAGNPAWVNLQNVVQSEIGDISYFEFLIPTFQEMPIKQQNMYAEFVVDGYWVDLHISKALYRPEEHKLFERIIKSAKFEPKKTKK
jgi:hypothetical protein